MKKKKVTSITDMFHERGEEYRRVYDNYLKYQTKYYNAVLVIVTMALIIFYLIGIVVSN